MNRAMVIAAETSEASSVVLPYRFFAFTSVYIGDGACLSAFAACDAYIGYMERFVGDEEFLESGTQYLAVDPGPFAFVEVDHVRLA